MKIRLLISVASREIIAIATATMATVAAVITSNGYGKERVQSQHRASMGNITGLSFILYFVVVPIRVGSRARVHEFGII